MSISLELVIIFIVIAFIYSKKRKKRVNILKFKNVQILSYDNYKLKERNSQIQAHKFSIKSKFVDEVMDYFVILPPNYDATKKYPSVYFLHGLRDSARSWIEDAKILENYEELLAKEEIEEMILVLPESGSDGRSWYTNWKKQPNKRYEDYFINDLIRDVDSRFNTDSNKRGICGFSMGGYGAYKLTLKNPKLFKTVASFAGAINFPRLLMPFLKRFGILRNLHIKRINDDVSQLRDVFGRKLKYVDRENVYHLLNQNIKHNYEDLKKINFYLSVGEMDNTIYTMFQQWRDLVYRLDKYNLHYEAKLIRNEVHRWEYVEKELENVLKFHSKHFN